MTHRRAIPRYLAVGGVCALLANTILIGFDRLGVNYAVSAVAAFISTLVVAYALHTDWTFEAERSFGGLVRYGAAMAMNLPVSIGLLFLLITGLRVDMTIAAPLATGLQTVLNYLIASTVIRPSSPSKQ